MGIWVLRREREIERAKTEGESRVRGVCAVGIWARRVQGCFGASPARGATTDDARQASVCALQLTTDDDQTIKWLGLVVGLFEGV